MPEDFRGFVEFSSNQSQDGNTECDIVDVITARLMKSLNLPYETPAKSLYSDGNGKSLLTSMFDGTTNSDDHSVAEDLPPDDHTQGDYQPYQCSLSLPTLSRLVSALKGSREKLGAPPKKKVSVSWAPDVYDPIPNPAYDVQSNNKKDKKKERGGKNAPAVKVMEKKKSRSFFTSMDNFSEFSDM